MYVSFCIKRPPPSLQPWFMGWRQSESPAVIHTFQNYFTSRRLLLVNSSLAAWKMTAIVRQRPDMGSHLISPSWPNITSLPAESAESKQPPLHRLRNQLWVRRLYLLRRRLTKFLDQYLVLDNLPFCSNITSLSAKLNKSNQRLLLRNSERRVILSAFCISTTHWLAYFDNSSSYNLFDIRYTRLCVNITSLPAESAESKLPLRSWD